ncbi:MAG TPA: aminoglycoside adenylyltransferase family protein [Marmoricola sp.]|nr:aminoglycoside adenylyltransferase family protein [Marmoricola sp.]
MLLPVSGRDAVVLELLTDRLSEDDPGGVLGLYLYGSSVSGGLRPDSDLDLLLVTRRSLSAVERRGLLELLLAHSGRRATVRPGRPLEVTSLVRDDVVPWRHPPVRDLQYGEWLRDSFGSGALPPREVDPDVAVLLTTVLEHSRPLLGPEAARLLDPVPPSDLRRAMHDVLPSLLGDLDGDERNVLLTLARMVLTVETGRIVAKDEAARVVLPGLGEPSRTVLDLARRAYRGEVADDWTALRSEVRTTAAVLAQQVRAGRA